jgi:hypothetical protein
MVDEAWIRELEVRAAPLRVELPPWGEVLARGALRAPARERVPQTRRWIIAGVAALAAAIAIAAWPSHAPTTNEATLVDTVEPEPTVAIPPPPLVVPPMLAPPVDPPNEELPRETVDSASLAKVPAVRAPAKRRTPRRSAAPAKAPPAAAPTDELPETLGTTEIKRALDAIKPQVNDCARTQGATPKLVVTIKLTVAGATGAVVSANIVKPELSAGLEQCILGAVHRAQFARFRKETLGVVFPLKLP